MKNISIVTPVYNEQENLPGYFNSLERIIYDLENIEVIFIDDCSTDSSNNLINSYAKTSSYKVKLIKHDKNLGRAKSRLSGVKKANYQNILLLDTKTQIFPDALIKLQELNYSPVSLNVIQRRNHLIDRCLYVVRVLIYSPYYNEDFKSTYINKNNFDKIPKGTTGLFLLKELFNNSQPENVESKYINDDINLIRNIVKIKPLLKASGPKLFYNTRKSLLDNINHVFWRGTNFVDGYIKTKGRYFGLIVVLPIVLILGAALMIWHFKIALLLFIFSSIFLSMYLKWVKKLLIQDILSFIITIPIIAIVFTIGIIRGLFMKMFKIY